MKINTILLESTYNLDFVDEIYSFILNKLKDKTILKLTKVNITNLIPQNINKKKYRIYFYFKTNPKIVEFTSEPMYKEDDEGDDVLFGFKITYVNAKPFNEYTKEELEQFKQTLKHEIVHVIDYIRGEGNSTDIDMIKIGTHQTTYFSDPGEVNAMINLLKEYKRKNTIAFNSIKTYKSLLQNIATIGQSRHEVVNKELLSDENIKNKILKRLAREDLIPTSLEY